MKRWISLAVVGMIAIAPFAAAQDAPGPMTWVALDKTKPGKGMELIAMTVKDDGPMYDELLANGTLLSWGIAIPINHRPGDDMNHMLWATMSDWSKVGGLQAGFMKLFASRTPEQSAAMQAAYQETVYEGSHHDWIIRQEVYQQGPGDQRPNYFYVGYYKAKPGMEDKLTAQYKSAIQPVYQKLLAEGTITSFGLSTQELHGDADWTHIGWYTMSDLGAIDAAHAAMMAGVSEAQMAEFLPMMEPEAHSDQVLLIVHLGGSGAGQ
jgi:hypothetical protein